MVDSNDRSVSLNTEVDHVFRSAGFCGERCVLTEPVPTAPMVRAVVSVGCECEYDVDPRYY